MEVPVQERQQREAEERDHEQEPGQVVERHGDARAEDVEEPDADDEADGNEVLEPEMDAPDGEVPLVDLRAAEGIRSELLVREPCSLGDVPDEQPEERQHDRPADPVAERRHRSDERRVLSPALVRVDRETAGLVREHRGELRVDDGDREDDGRRDAPDQHRAPAAHVEHGPPERPQQKAWIREADDEPVVPAERLEKLSFLDDCLSHGVPPSRPPDV